MRATRREIGRRGQARAAELHEKLRIQSIEEIDVAAIAAKFRVFVELGGLRGADGRLARREVGGIVRINDGIKTIERIRYITAHELGHFILHVDDEPVPMCTEKDFLAYHSGDRETEANWFAAELLMPRGLFEPRCDVAQPSFAHIEALKKDFKTTLTATTVRFVDLAPERCAVVWGENGKIKWAIRGREFFGEMPFDRPMSKFCHARDAFDGKRLPTGPQLVPASAWVNGGGGEMYEDTRWFSKLQATLTLLWWPEGKDEDDDDDDRETMRSSWRPE